ncbi:hypothetical protein CF319_g1456 [Tilletia indica]|uniref:Transmembrane protein n=1 Tax=Tilletia indica TaxID=43049 RepID=A0A177TWQ0_9BASI|nr:hypothetical protein CF319_g1456 [Tilletia indica]KAE8234811.1 hypothetical protein CF326_g153 [Tilletia indica]KAE8246664.1 hypothetical protein A4X13_0g5687 [Tilletia indica]
MKAGLLVVLLNIIAVPASIARDTPEAHAHAYDSRSRCGRGDHHPPVFTATNGSDGSFIVAVRDMAPSSSSVTFDRRDYKPWVAGGVMLGSFAIAAALLIPEYVHKHKDHRGRDMASSTSSATRARTSHLRSGGPSYDRIAVEIDHR